ncbi:MAG TPA: esterase family protein, partial [Flavobacteriaceae bacterium]|nr:esterase family protein [Flavobacteriaceae bacterium]
MKKEIKAVVIKPDSYQNHKKLPVVYLLHGYSGNYSDWIKKVPEIKHYVDRYQLIIVCPDGNFNSWYLDSEIKKNSTYETYIAKELVSFIDKNYNTIAHRNGRAITGLSMGGHGALYVAFKNQDVFANAGSMSGGLDLRPFKDNWELDELLGNYENNPERWEENSV